jgi:hypothetical protein
LVALGHRDVGKSADDHWRSIADGTGEAIHRGEGAENRLLVIMQGDRLLCYVNDHFVGSYTDEGAPQSGHMGVYSNVSDVEGVYSDFTVYPAPPLTFPFG